MTAMTASSFAWLAGDEHLLLPVLRMALLQDWCALQACSTWAAGTTKAAQPRLAAEICEEEAAQFSVWELCQQGELTQLWARLGGPEASLLHPDSGKVIVDPNANNSVLHCVLVSRPCPVAMVALLLSLPGAGDAAMSRNTHGRTALHLCCKHGLKEAAQLILRLPGIDVNARDSYDQTPLLAAVHAEHPDLVEVMLAAGADPNIFVANCHGHGDTALILAVRLRNADIVQLLVASPLIDLQQTSMRGVPFGWEALDFAPWTGPIRPILEEAIVVQTRKRLSDKRAALERLAVESREAKRQAEEATRKAEIVLEARPYKKEERLSAKNPNARRDMPPRVYRCFAFLEVAEPILSLFSFHGAWEHVRKTRDEL